MRYNLAVLKFIRPCSPIRVAKPQSGPGWVHEPKLDGYRIQIVKDGADVRLYSRNGHEWTKRLATLTEAFSGIPARSAIIDGELCFPTPSGAPDFYGLSGAMVSGRQHELAVLAFDLLHRDGRDLTGLPLVERRKRLERLHTKSDVPCLYLVGCYDDGARLLKVAERFKLEGIVSKRKAAPYRSGDDRNWAKVKTTSWREENRERWRLFEGKR